MTGESEQFTVRSFEQGRLGPARSDDLAVEEPLEIRVAGRPVSVTMRTPGHDDELAAGFLLGEGIVRRREDIGHIRRCPEAADGGVIDVLVSPGVAVDFAALTRHVFASSSCGVCGLASIDAVRKRLPGVESRVSIRAQTLLALPGRLRQTQPTFDATGGLHAAGLFDGAGTLLVSREDVGRHNAVDKVVGHALLHAMVPLSSHVLLVSGRASFEIVQKALAAGISIIAAVSAPSSLAVELAEEAGITLAGFLRPGRFNVYAHAHRIDTGDQAGASETAITL